MREVFPRAGRLQTTIFELTSELTIFPVISCGDIHTFVLIYDNHDKSIGSWYFLSLKWAICALKIFADFSTIFSEMRTFWKSNNWDIFILCRNSSETTIEPPLCVVVQSLALNHHALVHLPVEVGCHTLRMPLSLRFMRKPAVEGICRLLLRPVLDPGQYVVSKIVHSTI